MKVSELMNPAGVRLYANIKEAGILMDIMGSDHCPVSLDIEI